MSFVDPSNKRALGGNAETSVSASSALLSTNLEVLAANNLHFQR